MWPCERHGFTAVVLACLSPSGRCSPISRCRREACCGAPKGTCSSHPSCLFKIPEPSFRFSLFQMCLLHFPTTASVLLFILPLPIHCVNAQQGHLQHEGQLTASVVRCMNRMLFELKLLSCAAHLQCACLFSAHLCNCTCTEVAKRVCHCASLFLHLSLPQLSPLFLLRSRLLSKPEVASPAGARGRDRALLITLKQQFSSSSL